MSTYERPFWQDVMNLLACETGRRRLDPERGDLACAECFPGGSLTGGGFQCYYHRVATWLEAQPKEHSPEWLAESLHRAGYL